MQALGEGELLVIVLLIVAAVLADSLNKNRKN